MRNIDHGYMYKSKFKTMIIYVCVVQRPSYQYKEAYCTTSWKGIEDFNF